MSVTSIANVYSHELFHVGIEVTIWDSQTNTLPVDIPSYHAAFRYYVSREMTCNVKNRATQDLETAEIDYIDTWDTFEGRWVVPQVDCKHRSMKGKHEMS